MSFPRKIYVEEGELVEIRVVSKGEQKNAAGFQERLYPVRHKYLIYIGSDSIEMPVVQPFGFKMCGKTWGPIVPHNASGQPRLAQKGPNEKE
jgi:hypothetical protein